MSKDVRVDIIYFNVSADWAFESELYTGPFRLRLLSQAVTSRVLAIRQLSKAVLRSETIIIVGGFYEEEKLPTAVASAIGFDLQRIGLPGASEEETILLPTGAKPLILDGKIRGATLKSGKQAIIFLDENRHGRLQLAKEQILPFLLTEQAITQKDFIAKSVETDPKQSDDIIKKNAVSQSSDKQKKDLSNDGAEKVNLSPVTEPEKIETERVFLSDSNKPGINIADIPERDELNQNDANIIRQLPKLKLSQDAVPKLPVHNLKFEHKHHTHKKKAEQKLNTKIVDKESSESEISGHSENESEAQNFSKSAQIMDVHSGVDEAVQQTDTYELHKGDILHAEQNDCSLNIELPENTQTVINKKWIRFVIIILLVILFGIVFWFGYKNIASVSQVSAYFDTEEYVYASEFWHV